MERRKEKGAAAVVVIIVLCLAFILFFGANGSLSGLGKEGNSRTGEAAMQISNQTANNMDRDIYQKDSYETEASVAQGWEAAAPVSEAAPEAMYRDDRNVLVAVMAGLLILYLIIIGPGLYFYLKKIGKMERMWLILPITTALFSYVIFACISILA